MFPFKFHFKYLSFEALGLLERVFMKDLFENKDVKDNSVQCTDWDSNRECLKIWQSRQTFKFNNNYC